MNTKKPRLDIKIFFLLSLFICCIFPVKGIAQVQDVVDTREEQLVTVYKGDVVTLKVYSLTRLAITETGVVEMGNVDVDEILLIGQNVGETIIFIWDEFGKRRLVVRVISQDLDFIMERTHELLKLAEIEGVTAEKNDLENKIVLTGTIPKQKEEVFNSLMENFPNAFLDLTAIDEEMIRIDVQITELSTTLTKTMGIAWTTGGSGLDFTYPETMPAFTGDFGDLFKIGDFERTTAITAAVNMLLAEGKARVLSKPSIIITAGESASFLVGGEVPVRTTTSSEGSVSENISYKSYGVDLSVTPDIKGEKIDVDLKISVRDIDASNAVGDDVAFTTRSASTRLLLGDGQIIILAGFIKSNKGEQVTRVPFLSKIPIVGLLFRSKNWTPNKEEELVISLKVSKLEKEEEKEAEDFAMQEDAREERYDLEAKIDSIILKDIEEDWVEQDTSLPEAPEEESALSEEEEILLEEESLWETQQAMETIEEAEKEIAQITDEEIVFPEEVISQTLTAYVQAVQKKISQAISFPYEAKEQGWEGTVKLTLIILSDGSLSDILLDQSSGYEIFDMDAINTTQLLAPFDPFPAEISLEEIKITLPIIYSQEAVLENVT